MTAQDGGNSVHVPTTLEIADDQLVSRYLSFPFEDIP